MATPKKIPPKVIFIKGPSDDFQVELVGVGENGDHQIATMGNSSNLFANLQLHLPVPSAYILLHPKRTKYPIYSTTEVFFNELSDPDNSGNMLRYCHRFLEKLEKKRPIKVINPPAKVLQLTRDQVYLRLKDIEGVVAPKTILCKPDSPDALMGLAKEHDIPFPFLVRSSGLHGGQDLQKIRGPEDFPLLHRYAYDGRSFYLTHFIDFKGERGNYSKIRLAVVEGVPYLRHRISDDDWCIHSHNREHMNKREDWIQEEVDFFNSFDSDIKPKIQARIASIANALDLDYFGIDASILSDGQILLFEANPAMNMLINTAPKPNIFEAPLDQIKKAIAELIQSRLA